MSLAGFFSLSLLASVFQYLFQILLARQLGEEQFAIFTARWAQFSFLLVVGGFLQVWAALKRMPEKSFRLRWAALTGLTVVVLAISMVSDNELLLQISALLAACGLSFLVGQRLGHGDHRGVGLLNFISAFLKVAGILLFLWDKNSIWLLVVLAGLLPQLGYLFLPQKTGKPDTGLGLTAALALALAIHLFPQLDGLWASYSQPNLTLIAPLTLITKAVFFFQLIFAQWWLPTGHQDVPLKSRHRLILSSLVLIFPAAVSLAGPWSFETFLGWTQLPSTFVFYLAGLHAALVGILYQVIQLGLLRGQLNSVWSALALIAAIWLSTLVFNNGPASFYVIMSLTHAGAILLLLRKGKV